MIPESSCRLAPAGVFALRAGRIWPLAEEGAAGALTGPLDDALVLGRSGAITVVGGYSALKDQAQADIQDLGNAELCPGLVNAHTHLSLSHIPANELTLGLGFAPWVRSLVERLRSPVPDEIVHTALNAAVADMAGAGVALAGEVGGRYLDAVWQALRTRGVDARIFLESLGFGPPGPAPATPDDWPLPIPEAALRRVAAAGHALYSTSPQALQRAKAWSRARELPFSLHLAEDAGETELLAHGTGELARFYREVGVLPRDYRAPGQSPVAYADSLGLLDERTLAVHCVHVPDEDIAILARSGATVVLCPRSNQTIGVGRAPWEKLLRAGMPLALATDGLCSAPDLNPLAELEFLLEHLEAGLPRAQALAMVTRTPGRALAGPDLNGLGRLVPGAPAVFTVLPALQTKP